MGAPSPLADLLGIDRDTVAVDDLARVRTWKELDERVARLRALFHASGLRSGDHIAMVMGNRVELVELVLAAITSGVVLTPVNWHGTADEMRYVLDDSGAALVLADAAHVDTAVAAASGRRVVEVGAPLDELLAELEPSPLEPDAAPGGTMFYTSGTTGRPKGVKRARSGTVAAQLRAYRAAGSGLGLDGAGPHLVTGPLYHAAPLGFAVMDLLNGASLVVMPSFDAEHTLELIAHRRVRNTHLVPTMFVRMLRLPEADRAAFDPSSLATVLHGAAPVAPSVKRSMIDWWGPVLVEYWGASEGGVVTLVDSHEWLRRPGTVGRPTTTHEVFAASEDGTRLPPGELGLLWCRNKAVDEVFEYHKDPDKTARTFSGPGTYTIGDIGYVDDDGYVFLADRQSNTIISGGVNIYPAEIEAVLVEHPAVADAAVFGVPDDEWGEAVRAAVELEPSEVGDGHGTGAMEAELAAFVRERLAGFKVPRSFEFHDRLPRTPNGKLATRVLREPHWRDRRSAI